MNIIEKIIHKKGLSIAEIAELTKWSRPTVYKYTANPEKMTVEQIKKLAVILGRSPRNLYTLITQTL